MIITGAVFYAVVNTQRVIVFAHTTLRTEVKTWTEVTLYKANYT